MAELSRKRPDRKEQRIVLGQFLLEAEVPEGTHTTDVPRKWRRKIRGT